MPWTSKERLAKRANRLLRSLRDAMPETYVADEGLRTIMEQPPVEAEDIDNVTMERIIGRTKDLLAIHFFDYGKRASQSVCRLVTRLGGGRLSYGTGFMVSPALLLTNHHVLEDAGMAAGTIAQFRYEPGERGSLPTREEFDLRPDRFFLNDKDLDFAVVAVAAKSRNNGNLGDFGFCPLIAAEGKIVPGEPVNIIQHPLGQPKQVVIRENKLLDLPKPADWDPKLDRYAQYEADTERGSSGSPVFNDQWEVVALHHSGVPKTNDKGETVDKGGNVFDARKEPSRVVWIGNEGIRVSRLMAFIEGTGNMPAEADKLRKQLIEQSRTDDVARPESARPDRSDGGSPSDRHPDPDRRDVRPRREAVPSPASTLQPARCKDGSMRMTIPLTITVSLGASGAHDVQVHTAGSGELRALDAQESVTPDEDYDHRPGFDVNFLGPKVPLPKLDNTIAAQAARVRGGGTELKYYNYSVVMNAKRRLAFVSAVNLDGQAEFQFAREGGDRWFFDPRIDKKVQIGNELYANNPYDRGHLTRRNDAAWSSPTTTPSTSPTARPSTRSSTRAPRPTSGVFCCGATSRSTSRRKPAATDACVYSTARSSSPMIPSIATSRYRASTGRWWCARRSRASYGRWPSSSARRTLCAKCRRRTSRQAPIGPSSSRSPSWNTRRTSTSAICTNSIRWRRWATRASWSGRRAP